MSTCIRDDSIPPKPRKRSLKNCSFDKNVQKEIEFKMACLNNRSNMTSIVSSTISVSDTNSESESLAKERNFFEIDNQIRKLPNMRCRSKNAIMAHNNRMKKKRYTAFLESEVSRLTREISELKQKEQKDSELVTSLRHENIYLKNVLANSKEISKLLRIVHHETGLETTSSLRGSLKTSDKATPAFGGEISPRYGQDKYLPDYNVMDNDSPTNISLNFSSSFLDESSLSSPPPGSPLSFPVTTTSDDFLDVDLPLFSPNSILPLELEPIYLSPKPVSPKFPLGRNDKETEADVGICLHVAKQRVSLELCAFCNSNAAGQLEGLPTQFGQLFQE